MKQKLLLSIALLLASTVFSQNKLKNINPSFFMEVPVESGIAFNGLNFGVGAWFGEQSKLASIGLFAGMLTYQPYLGKATPITQKGTLTLAFDIKTKSKILVIPAFVIGTKEFYDINIKLGFGVDKYESTYVTLFASKTYNMGIGVVVKMK